MNPTIMLSILSGLAAAVWSVWTWGEEQQKERQLKRDQEAALYVNSFILAIEELQSQLYNVLEEDELVFYKKEYPEQYEFGSPAAIEILYRLSQYFGWGHHTFRYGPYTRDPVVIELIRRIGETCESRCDFPGDAFRFSYDERVSLGKSVVRRIGEATAILPVFESIPLYQFEEEMSNEQSKHAPIYQSKAVRSTLAAVDKADRSEALEGRERLAVLQNLLVDLLAYLENREGFRVSIGELRKVRVSGSYALAPLRESGMVQIVHQTRGRIRLGIPRLKTDKTFPDRLKSVLESIENIASFRISTSAASVAIQYSKNIGEMEFSKLVVKAIKDEIQSASV